MDAPPLGATIGIVKVRSDTHPAARWMLFTTVIRFISGISESNGSGGQSGGEIGPAHVPAVTPDGSFAGQPEQSFGTVCRVF